jgi:2-succinyl-5-enolpyruvyl-6-hydroxy-3-cyclohexene-1-carboxylate synthase
VKELAETLQWPTLPDVTSGLRLGTSGAPFVHYYDQLLLSGPFQEECTPDTVLHVGGPFVSKRLLQLWESRPPEHYIMVADHPRRSDPAHRVTLRIEADVQRFARWLIPSVRVKADENWTQAWFERSARVERAVETVVEDRPDLTEIAVARLVSKHIPEHATLVLGNSMPIRDMDMYGAPCGPRVVVAANRGASGIDGAVATAAGYANALRKPVAVVLGDLALLHDLNSLALLRTTAAPVVVVVLNNNGGGVFSFLPIAGFRDHFERYFAAPHGLRFDQAAEMFGLGCANPSTKEAFLDAFRGAMDGGRAAIIEVTTDRDENYQAHQALEAAVVAALEAA